MPAPTSREAARERLRKLFGERLEQFIPQDHSVPLRVRLLIFSRHRPKNAACSCWRRDGGALQLDGQARVEQPGRCPYCRSKRVYLRGESPDEQRQSAFGRVQLNKQRCRCRACGKTFSPAGS